VNVFVPKDDSIALEFYEGILNSALMWAWFQHNAKKRGVGLEINGNVFQRVPIQTPDLKKKQDREAHDEIVNQVRKIKEQCEKARAKGLEEESIEGEIAILQKELDDKICALYRLSKGETQEVLRKYSCSNSAAIKKAA
jgi:hypothetical protein